MKTKLAFWVVSHCKTSNGREDYVQAIQKYIQVDVFGKCSSTNKTFCESSRDDFNSAQSQNCFEKYSQEYFFYLAFENSNCKGYSTEKFETTTKYPIVPIVMRGEMYSIHPPGSSINVRDFTTVKELADYLTMLSQNESAYMEYFNWKQDYVSYYW
jgi:hypothetical protein